MEIVPEESHLLRKAKAGNADVFAQLYDSYVERVYRYIYFWTTDDVAAEKITSHVFIMAWQKFDRYRDGGSSFAAWLYKLARIQVTEYYSYHPKPAIPKFSITLPAASEEADSVVNGRASNGVVNNLLNMQAMRGALQSLLEEQQQVLVLKFMDDMPLQNIACILSRHEDTLPALLLLALRNLAGHLKNTGPALTVPVDVLDDCLDQLNVGTSTLDESLVRHPGHGSQLKPLLQTALFLKLGREVKPLDDFKIRARINLTQFMRFNPRLRQRARPLLIQAAATMTVLLMALFVTGTVRVQSALPGDEFYTWKRVSEQVWRAVSLDAVATDIILSNRRASEWIAVANDPLLNESAQAGYFEVLNRFLSENDIQAFGRLLPDLYKQHNMLNHAGLSTPELDHYLVVVIASAPIETVVQVIPTPSPTRVVPTATRIRPAPTATAVPTIFAPTVTPSAIPTATPTDVPTATATNIPTATPTKVPTATPTDVPTATPTVVPTSTPTNVPTATPTVVPTSTPTDLPTSTPTDVLTATPVNIPPANPP